MPDLSFQIDEAEVAPRSASPQLVFKLAVSNTPAEERIHTMLLQCQIQFEASHRSYSDQEKEKLRDLFGAPDRWGQTVSSIRWTQANVTASSFTGRTVVDLPAPCTYDLTAASTKYFYGLEDGEVPLLFLFSGTVFYAGAGGRLQVHHIARSKECSYRMPVERWKGMMERHYPNTAWLYLQQDTFDRLYAYKRRHGLPTWEAAVEQLLPEEEAEIENAPEPKPEATP